jgi:hypothetical protein
MLDHQSSDMQSSSPTSSLPGASRSNLKELALRLAETGFYVFPVNLDKTPRGKWKELATNDPDAIEVIHWDGLIGIYCSKSKFFAIDLDRKHGVDGLATWEGWQDHYGTAPAGPAQITPHGKHLLFKLPENLTIPNKAGWKPGIDLRSEGYICTGPGYAWITPPGTALPEAPAWFLDLFDPQLEIKPVLQNFSPQTAAADYWLEKYLPRATIGRRNATGFEIALQCRDSGIPRAETEALPYPEICLQGQDVYSRDEWLATVKSVYDRAARPAAHIGTKIPAPPDLEPARGSLDSAPNDPENRVSQPAERPRFILRNAAYALQPQPPIDYIVDDLITNSSVNVIYGEPGSKKTYTALSLAVCVANGRNWLDFKTRKVPVLIIDEESGEKRLSRRLGEAIRGESGDTTSPIFYISLAGFKLDDPTDPILIHALIEQTGAHLVIIDALADIMDGDENDKKDVQPVFNALRKIAENTDSAILIIHHSNKAGGYRGSSAIKGSIDLMIQVTSENGSNLVNFNTEKNRDGDKTTWAAEAIWAEDQFYLKPTTRQVNEHGRAEAYIINFLTENGASYVDVMMASAEPCSSQKARQAVYSLARKGMIKRINTGKRAIYEIDSSVCV